MNIQFNNYRELLKDNGLNNLTYEERFEFYCNDFPEMRRLDGLRDCELVQLYDALKRGFDLQQAVNDLATEWLEEEYIKEDKSYDDLSTELKSFLWHASNEVWYAAN